MISNNYLIIVISLHSYMISGIPDTLFCWHGLQYINFIFCRESDLR